jgi:arabinosaccharide transport system substrate-binding protein
MNYFPYGKAALSILLMAILSGLWLLSKPIQEHSATLVYWTSAEPHYNSYKKILPKFEREHPGVTVDLELVSGDAVSTRMQSAMLANLDVPDLFEINIGDAGALFRGPVSDIGLLDLTSRVNAPGPGGAPSFYDRCVKARFVPYTHLGRIYGLPHDVHPLQLAYRRDIFSKYGIDPSELKTWDDFIRVGQRITIPGKQYMIELSDSDNSGIEPMLLQRGGDYFDANGNVAFDNDIAVQTMCWYVPLVAGPKKIADSLGLFTQAESKGIEDGYMVCYICPDWRSKNFENTVGAVSGLMGLMPLPMVQPGTRPTSTWGGTMVGITKHCKTPDLAWQLAMFFYLDKSGVNDRYQETNIIPPVRDQWKMPIFHQPRAYWAGQVIGESYIKLANDVPARHSSPAIEMAGTKLGEAVVDCVQYYDTHGCPAQNNPQFVNFVRARLKEKADEVRAVIRRDPK